MKKGKIVQNEEPIFSNQLIIKPVKEGDSHRYLGIDENI